MAEAIKVLGQANPAVTTLTDLYAVPALTETVVSTLTAANRTNSNARIRVSVAIAGATDSDEQYILYDVLVLKKDFLFATVGLTLAAADVVRVETDTAGISFNLFGTEVT